MYLKTSTGAEVCITPHGTFLSGTTQALSEKFIESYKWIHDKVQDISDTGEHSLQYNTSAESYRNYAILYNGENAVFPEEDAAQLRLLEDMYAGKVTEEEVFPNENTVIFDMFEYKLNSDNETISISKYKGSDEQIRIPEKIDGHIVTGILYDAFKWSDMNTVVIPDTVTDIASSAFDECKSLENVVLPNSLKTMVTSSFRSCEKLGAVYYRGNKFIKPRSVVYILNMNS